MPLTNVYTRDHKGEWVRTTAAAMDREYNYSVSVNSCTFRCYNCFQYVTFVKGNGNKISHFKHNGWEDNKDCEDRTIGLGGYAYGMGLTDVPDPMRLKFDGNRPYLEIGFFPISSDAIDKAIENGTIIRIKGNGKQSDLYKVDRSRFEPSTTAWLHLPFSWAEDFSVCIEPMSQFLKVWDIKRVPLSKKGTVFDASIGKRIPEKGDISVGKEYFVIANRWKDFHSWKNIEFNRKTVIDDKWCFYRMRIPSYNEDAADFCFSNFHLRLTTQPVDIQLLWPPAIERDDLIDTNQKQLFIYVKGESDFETFPSYGTRNKTIAKSDSKEKIIELDIVTNLQMVSATRFKQRLKFLYVRPWIQELGIARPSLRVLDDQNKEIEDILKNVPIRKILRIVSDVDATVDVEDQNGFLYRLEVPANQETRLQEIKLGMTLIIRQGMETLRKIIIGEKRIHEISGIGNSISVWKGRIVPIPRRYAWILKKLEKNSEIYQRAAKAMKDGKIPIDGLADLIKIAEGK